MNVVIENNISFEDYKHLRSTTNWTQLKDEQIEKLLKNTTFMVSAKVDGKTVGLGRCLFDFGYSAFLADIIIEPEFQGKGIGRAVVETLIDMVKKNSMVDKGGYLMFSLLAAPGKSGFYEKLGFYKRVEENGYGMCLKNTVE